MTEKEFVIWLHGFLEISCVKTLDENQLQVIEDHLNVFFTKITPEQRKMLTPEQRKMLTPPPPLYPPLNWPTISKVPGNTPPKFSEIWCCDNTLTQHPNNQTYC
jgi:hypothetical protein